MKKITTVLFDFDGTLMNTNEVIINSWQHTFKELEGKEVEVKKIIETLGETLEFTMEKFFPNVDVKEAIKIYRSYHAKNFGDMISLFPNGKEILEKLKKDGYKLGLVTSRLKGTTYEGLEYYKILEYFDAVVTKEDTTRHKPDPEPIEEALKRLKALPEEAIMIGDTLFDIECAKNAKMQSVLVGWSLSVDKAKQETLMGREKPDYIIEDLMEIDGLVNKV